MLKIKTNKRILIFGFIFFVDTNSALFKNNKEITILNESQLSKDDINFFKNEELFMFPYKKNNNKEDFNYLFFIETIFNDTINNLNKLTLKLGIISFKFEKNDHLHIYQFCINNKLQNNGFGSLCFSLFLKKTLLKHGNSINSITLIDDSKLIDKNGNKVKFYQKFFFCDTSYFFNGKSELKLEKNNFQETLKFCENKISNFKFNIKVNDQTNCRELDKNSFLSISNESWFDLQNQDQEMYKEE